MTYDPHMRDDWDDSKLVFCRPENFSVRITLMDTADFSTEDIARLTPKLNLVQEIAKKLASGMVKGTLKYQGDDRTVDEWLDYLLDDASDVLNYAFFLREARQREINDTETRLPTTS